MAKEGFLGHFGGLAWPGCDLYLDPLQHCFMDAGWEAALGAAGGEPSPHFDSALSSLVSSPSSRPAPSGSADGGVVRELIGRLGGICGGGGEAAASPPSSRHASCYSTPLNSPPKPSPSPPQLPAGARLSCFGGGGGGAKMSCAASSQLLLAAASAEEAARGGAQLAANERSSSDSHGRKRKASAKGKGKEPASAKMPDMETNAKKCKLSPDMDDSDEEDEGTKPKAEQNGEAEQGSNPKLAEPPRDYIHVRARRGQATDSHSLAERVRREKISERMKLLQDPVPGCNKVTGKAVMLDEIINYVQSLQRQVEFLSMKLATVNPRLDFNVENFLPKDVHQSPSSAFSYAAQPQGTPIGSAVTNAIDTHCSSRQHQTPLDGFATANSQIGNLWEDDLQSVVQMGFGHSQEGFRSM